MAAPQLVRTKTTVTAFSTSVANSFPSDVVAIGNHVVVMCAGEGGQGEVYTCADNQGGSNVYTKYAEAPVQSGSASNRWTAFFIAPVIASSGTFTVTVTRNGTGNNIESTLFEVSGADLTTVPAGTFPNNSATRTAWTINLPDMTGDAILFAIYQLDTAGVTTHPPSWTNLSHSHYTSRITSYKRENWTGTGDSDPALVSTNTIGGAASAIALNGPASGGKPASYYAQL